jgi:RNA polymerase sigma-70 factor, ECF subfamily
VREERPVREEQQLTSYTLLRLTVQKGSGLRVEQPPQKVVRKAAEGEERALEVLIRSYYGPIQGYLERVVGDVADAQDLTQEVFLRMARGLPAFEGRAKFTTWLFQIAKNLGIDFLRKREIERVSSYQASMEARPGTTGEHGVEESELLWASIGSLDVDLRSALVLRDVYGFTYKEIAEIVGATLATVKWRIYQAREQVHAAYDAAADGRVNPVEPLERGG